MFEFYCGESTACSASFGAAILLGLVAAGCFIALVVARLRGIELKRPKKLLLVGGVIGGAVLAGGLQHAATAVFGPDLAQQEGFEDDFEADFEDDLGDDPKPNRYGIEGPGEAAK